MEEAFKMSSGDLMIVPYHLCMVSEAMLGTVAAYAFDCQ